MISKPGRKIEVASFKKLLASPKSEFVVVYGRRRVGKTFLIRSIFENQFTFQITGIANATLMQQLTNFQIAIQKYNPSTHYDLARSWIEAFQQLIVFLEKKNDQQKKIVFIDELPWFDTANSGFIPALEHFWNSWASSRTDILLIGCGSAASWMISELINSKGGLHNRVTHRIKLNPFTLGECEELMQLKNINLDRYQLVQLYMVFGGIPFYWDEVQPGLSATQNIENSCFTANGLLRNEFGNLYKSLFKKAERHEAIVQALAQKVMGLTRDQIIKSTGLANAGSTTRLLDELEESGFIRKYLPFEKKERNSLYQLTDFYSLFYMKFIHKARLMEQNNWLSMLDNPTWRAWSGYAYEQVCLYHVEQIKKALGISGVQTEVSSWRSSSAEPAVQVDLIIDRRDHVINLCEMKFSVNQFTIEKAYSVELQNKIGTFRSETKTHKSVFLTLITTFGLQQNNYSESFVQNDISMEALFEK